MNPAQRQTAEGILFTEVDQFSLPHSTFNICLHKKQAQIDRFFRGYPNDNIPANVLERLANQFSSGDRTL